MGLLVETFPSLFLFFIHILYFQVKSVVVFDQKFKDYFDVARFISPDFTGPSLADVVFLLHLVLLLLLLGLVLLCIIIIIINTYYYHCYYYISYLRFEPSVSCWSGRRCRSICYKWPRSIDLVLSTYMFLDLNELSKTATF